MIGVIPRQYVYVSIDAMVYVIAVLGSLTGLPGRYGVRWIGGAGYTGLRSWFGG